MLGVDFALIFHFCFLSIGKVLMSFRSGTEFSAMNEIPSSIPFYLTKENLLKVVVNDMTKILVI